MCLQALLVKLQNTNTNNNNSPSRQCTVCFISLQYAFYHFIPYSISYLSFHDQPQTIYEYDEKRRDRKLPFTSNENHILL